MYCSISLVSNIANRITANTCTYASFHSCIHQRQRRRRRWRNVTMSANTRFQFSYLLDHWIPQSKTGTAVTNLTQTRTLTKLDVLTGLRDNILIRVVTRLEDSCSVFELMMLLRLWWGKCPVLDEGYLPVESWSSSSSSPSSLRATTEGVQIQSDEDSST